MGKAALWLNILRLPSKVFSGKSKKIRTASSLSCDFYENEECLRAIKQLEGPGV